MITGLITIILAFTSTNPAHPLHKNEVGAESMAIDVLEAANRFQQDPEELLNWGIHESSLRARSVGKLGDVGYMQAHGVAAAQCTAVGLTPGSFMCGSYLWSRGEMECGSHLKSLYLYASGKCNGTPKAKRLVRRRMKKLKEWRDE